MNCKKISYKKIIYFLISILFLILILIINTFFLKKTSHWESCKYNNKIEKCLEANKSWKPRSIKDFICLTSNDKEKIIYQIVLDQEFKIIDQEIEFYLNNLEQQKDKYFWKNAKITYLWAIDEITRLFYAWWVYSKKYDKICGIQIIKEVQLCQSWKININNAISAFGNSTCSELARIKLNIYKKVAFDILMLNKIQVRKDTFKKYTINEIKKYDKLIDVMMINIWYMERILKKWTSKIKNTL